MKKRTAQIEKKAPEKKELALISDNAPAIQISKLSKAQEQLLEQLRDPACVNLDVMKICKLAGITRATYYNCFKDDNFVKAVESSMQEYRNSNEFLVLHNVTEQAKRNQKNFHWAQMFLQMQGRLQQGASKPAIVTINFGGIKRPPKVVAEGSTIDIEAEEVNDPGN